MAVEYQQYTQSEVAILAVYTAVSQAQANTKQEYLVYAQAQAQILQNYWALAQSDAAIKATYQPVANAQASIVIVYTVMSQTQAHILATYSGYANAQAQIGSIVIGQAEAHVLATSIITSQSQVHTLAPEINVYSQAQAVLNQFRYTAQAEAKLNSFDYNQYAQALVWVDINLTTVYFLDTFSRTDTSAPPFNLGSPDIGSPWVWVDWDSSYSEATSPTHVENGALVSTMNGYDSMTGPPVLSKGDFYLDFWVPAAGDNNADYRYYDSNWFFRIDFYSDTEFSLIGQSDSIIVGSITRSTWYRVHAIVDIDAADKVKIAVWRVGDSEPSPTVVQTYAYSSGYTPYLDIYYGPATEFAKFDNIRIQSGETFHFNQGIGQAQVKINTTRRHAQARLLLYIWKPSGVGQAQASILQTYRKYSQARVILNQLRFVGQAETHIHTITSEPSQAEAKLNAFDVQRYAQAEVILNQSRQAAITQAHIFAPEVKRYAQACAWIAIRLTGLLFSDTFSRTTTAPPFNVGDADTGQHWNYVNYSNSQTEANSTVYVNGSSLIVENPSSSYIYASINGPSSITEEGDLYFDIYIPSARSSAYHYTYWYDKAWYFYLTESSATQYRLRGYNGTYLYVDVTRESWYRVHIQVNSSDTSNEHVKARMWKVGDAEPETWVNFQDFWPYDATGASYTPFLYIRTPYYYSSTGQYDYPPAKLDNIIITSAIYQMINYGAGNAGAWIKEENKSQPAQAEVILNQSMYVAQSHVHILTTYPQYSQAQAFIRKLAGYAQAQVRIPYPTDAYSLMVKEDGATHFYGVHPSNFAYAIEDEIWQDEIGIADSTYVNYYWYSAAELSPVGPEYYGIRFDYYREYVQFENRLTDLDTPTAGEGTWTVETWVQSPSVTSIYSPIFEVYGGSSRYINLGFGSATAWSTGNSIRLAIYDSTGTTWHDTGIAYATTTWYHVAVTYNNGYFKVYINGQLTNEITRTTWNTVDYYRLNIGYSSYNSYRSTTTGNTIAYDNIAVYPIELAQGRIQEHYAKGNARGLAQALALLNRGWGLGQAAWYTYDPTGLNHWQTFSQTQAHILTITSSLAQATARITDAKDQNVYASAQAIIIPEQGLLRYFIQGSSANYSLPDQGTYAQITSMTAVTDPGQIAEGDYGSNYGTRWQGWFVADMSGPWWFQTRSDDGSGIFIYNEQDQLVGSMNNGYGTGHGAVTVNGTINLVAGTKYKIDVKHAEGGGGAEMSAWYARPGSTTAMYLLAGEAPWNDKSYLPTVRYWGMGLANALWVERNGDFFVWPNYAQAQAKVWYPAQKGYGQAVVQIGAFWPAQAITQIAYEVPDTYRSAVLADKPILHYPMDEQTYGDGILHTIIGRRDATWSGSGETFNYQSAIGLGSSIDFNGYAASAFNVSTSLTTIETLTLPGTWTAGPNCWRVSNQFWMNAGDSVSVSLNAVSLSTANISLGIYKYSDGSVGVDNQYAYIGSGPQTGTFTRTATQTGIYFVYLYSSSGQSAPPTGSGTVIYSDYTGDSAIPITDGSPVTVEAWIKPDLATGDPRMIFGFAHNYVGVWSDGRIGFGDGAGHSYWTSAGRLVANTTWYHIAAVFYSGQACTSNKLYINGELQTLSINGTNVVRYSAQNFVIGGWKSNTSYRWTAPMDEMSIFDHELTPEQIIAHYRAYKKQYYGWANAWLIGHPTAHGQALWFTGRQPDGIYHELKNYGQARPHIKVTDNTASAQARALIQSDYGLTRMTWNNANWVVGDIFNWNDVEWELGNPNYSTSGAKPSSYPGESSWGMAWSGNFIADVTGTWQFRTSSDDGSDLWISETRVVNNNFGSPHGTVTASGTIDLVQGNFYTIHTRFGQGGGPWVMSVQYKRPADVDWYYLTDNAPPWIRKYWHGGFAQATAEILPIPNIRVYAQAQAKLNSFDYPQRAQAQADILQIYRKYAQAHVVLNRHWGLAQAKTTISHRTYRSAQAIAHVGWLRLAQAQAKLNAFNVPRHAQAKAHIRVFDVNRYAQARAKIVHTVSRTGLAAVAIKQTYPFRYINPNYALTASGTTVTPDPEFSLEGTIPENVLDGNPNSVWTNFLAIDTDEGVYFYLNLDLGASRTISSYYILPVKYNVTANLQYSTNGSTWYDIVTGIYFDVSITSPIRYSDAITGEITPINARFWRLKFINGGDDNKVSIATFQLGTALTQNPTFGQAQAFFGKFGVAQAIAYIAPGLSTNWGQAKAQIRQTYTASGNAQFWYLPPTTFGSAQAVIIQIYQLHGLAMAWALPPTVFGLSQVHILTTYQGQGQATADIQTTYGKYGAAKVSITKSAGDAQAMVFIVKQSGRSGYAMVYIGHFVHGVASAFIVKSKEYAQALAIIKQDYGKHSQALVFMRRSETYSQSRTWINRTYSVYGQSLVILNQYRRMANAKTSCVRTYMPTSQAKYHIHAIVSECSQAQVVVRRRYPYNYGQSCVFITRRSIYCGLAMAQVGAFKYANAQARIIAFNVPKVGLAAGYILVDINVPAPYPASNLQSYLIRYNNQTLPGYAQSEFLSSVARLSSKKGAYIDGSLVDYLGLENKEIKLKMLVWEPSYLECKIRVQEAATILRTKRRAYNKLYIQQYDKYYEAMPKSITTEKSVSASVHVLEYEVILDAKPWLISNDLYTFIGTDSIETTDRTLLDGGWTPTLIMVSGTDITISGVTEYGEDTGSVTISGTVSNYIIDSDKFETSDNTLITPVDYGLYVGPGKTFFTIIGATSCRIEYRNRWYI